MFSVKFSVRPKPHTDKSPFLPPTVDVPLEDTEFADKEKDAALICKFHSKYRCKARFSLCMTLAVGGT